MTAPDFARVATVVAGVHGLDGTARAAYLDAACAGDPALRAEVESLLAQDAALPPLLATAGALVALAATADIESGAEAETPPAIGGYRLLGVLGQGGMGTVYRAAQTVPLHRDVALKLVRRGLDTDRIIARFAAERQTLALMDHPAIARVIDAGASDDGRPYFVMELVEGTPITTLCEARRLALDDRLALFLAVCAGVQHAHPKGVIHRDLKPSNVLVRDQDGRLVPKIIDFGITKAIGDDTQGTLLTKPGDVMGTPEYMSPEQAGVFESGVDTRTDVYSLGVILYELLTGTRPYVFTTGTIAEIQRVLADTPAPRPSAAAPARRRELAGDLDNIVLKALAKAPADRYGSVEQFADDVRRHLDGLPVRARAATWTYRGAKFVRRHRAGVAAATAALLLLGGSAAMLGVQATRLAVERDRAVAAEQRARAEATTSSRVTEFLVDVFEVSDPSESRGNSVTVREVLDRGAAQIDAGLKDEPEIRATLQVAIGRVYQNLGLPRVAETLLETALAGRRAVLGDDHASVGESLDYLARLKREMGTSTEAEALYREALAIKRQTLGPAHPSIALTLNNLANAVRDRNAFAEAEALAREGLEMRRALLGDEHPDVAESLHDLSAVLWLKGDFVGAETQFRATLALDRKLHGDLHPVVVIDLNSLGQVLTERGLDEEAEAVLRQSHAGVTRLYPYEHRETAMSLRDIGVALVAQRRFDEGEALLREGLAIHQRISGRQSDGVWHCLLRLGRSRLARGDLEAAEALFREVLAIGRHLYGGADARVARALTSLAGVLRLRGGLDEARQLAQQAVDLYRAALGDEHRTTAQAIEERAAVTQARGELLEAEGGFREVLRIRRAVLPAGHAETGTALFQLGSVLHALRRTDEAAAALRESLAIRRDALPAGHAGIAEAERALAQARPPPG